MAQDIRDMLKDYQPEGPQLSKGHEARFEDKLDIAFSEKKSDNSFFFWMKIAATVIVFLTVGYFGYQYFQKDTTIDTQLVNNTKEVENETPTITIGNLSPDLKKVEDFYVTGINQQLASLNRTPENEELINGYLLRLEELDNAYKTLNTELNEVGPSEATITALIDNLKLRLELLFKLKNKLKELKTLENEDTKNMEA
ncbi:MAG TPA: hypothetical protein DCS66_08215 [Flavobacteriaceae bacterium]|nr:hypothetical protein [Flavobacteriaceae bacterium]|tara:strand:+ start:37 stop:630 length:594 start_codon:yes stop_codon:yes gene_type:complete